MDKDILPEFEKKFEALRKELGITATLDEMDKVFFLRDYMQREGFVSNQLARQVSRRVVDTFMNWYGYLHGLIMPNPSSLPSVIESQKLDEEKKDKVNQVMAKLMAFSSKNTLIGIKHDRAQEGAFINECVQYWNETLCPLLIDQLGQVNELWEKKTKATSPKQRPSDSYYG